MCKIKINTIFPIIILHCLIFITKVSANNEFCYTSSGVFGIIIASVVITLVVIGLTLATLWFLWTKNRLKLDFIFNKNKTNTGTNADVESSKHEFAFDNPYFKDDDTIDGIKKDNYQTQKDTIILLEGKENNKEKICEEVKNEKVLSLQDKQRNGRMANNRFVKSLPLSAVFNHVPILNKKHKHENQKFFDDSFIRVKPERLEVELIGRDFTGLGFNLCGNMKDGIFIKDVLNRGPANESGKVKAGDRIISVNVSFEKMVFEDAVAILSYASPYNVKIELEKSLQFTAIDRLPTNAIINKNTLSNTNRQLLHPLYRSHSVDDLTRIGKELSLSEKSTSSSGKNVVQKIKSQIFNRKHNDIKASNLDENVNKSSNLENETEKRDNQQIHCIQSISEQQIVNKNEPQLETSVKSDAFKDQTEINTIKDSEQEVVNVVIHMKEPEGTEEAMKHVPENQVIKKPVTPAKRKGRAPQPPIGSSPQTDSLQTQSISENQSNCETIETTAQVHNEEIETLKSENKLNDETQSTTIESDIKTVELNGHLSSSSESVSSEEYNTNEDSNLVPLQSNSPQRVQSPTGKPKSSSMSDLTISNAEKLQSVLLERAVSLDMNAQNLPEENLYQHGKNLLVTDVENADSMPIINWYSNKQSLTDTNSSESTLNELNQPFIINNELSETIPIDLPNNSSDSSFDIQNDDKIGDDTKFISHITVEPNTSTPVKMNINNDIDQYIKSDSSSSSSDDETEEKTLVGKVEPNIDSNIESISPDLMSNNTLETNKSMENKEVIELSQSELDEVMMSHKQFLIKQAKTNGSYPNIMPPLKPSGVDSRIESLDFESWSYLSEEESKPQNIDQSTLYTTALDISDSNESENSFKPKKLPEVAGITLKTGENGQLTNTVIIATTDLSNSSFSSTSSSPPSN